MAVSTIKAVLNAELAEVWRVVLDVGQYPAWRSDLSGVKVIGEERFIEYAKEGVATEFRVTEVRERERWAFDMENANMKGRWVGIFSAKGKETEVEFTEIVEAKKWLMKPFVRGYLKKQQERFIADLREALRKSAER